MTDPVRVYSKGWSGFWERCVDWLYRQGFISEKRSAEMRWTQHNRQSRARGCPCGKPATVHRDYPVTGRVPYQSWTCDEHAGADGFATTTDGSVVATFMRAQQCESCDGHCSSGGPIGGPTAHWYCPIREMVSHEMGQGGSDDNG